MSYDESDARWDAMWEAADEALYPEHFERAVAEFTAERLRSFYVSHRDVALAPLRALHEARSLLRDHPDAALVFAGIAVEVGLREAIVRPITHGLVHDEELATTVTDLLMDFRPPLDRLRQIALRILAQHGGTDLDADRRPGATEALWPEMKRLQKKRNDVLHGADSVPHADAQSGVALAAHFIEVVIPQLLARLELDLGSDGLVSCDTGWTVRCDGRLSGPLRGRYGVTAGRIYGPCAGGQYILREDGRLLDGASDTGFYLANGRLYGPTRRLPWVAAREELAALLKAAQDWWSQPPGTSGARFRRFVQVLFNTHAIQYEPGMLEPRRLASRELTLLTTWLAQTSRTRWLRSRPSTASGKRPRLAVSEVSSSRSPVSSQPSTRSRRCPPRLLSSSWTRMSWKLS